MLTKDDLQEIGIIMKQELEPLKKDLSSVKKSVLKIQNTVNIMVKMFDTADVKLQKRVTRIEEHLDLPKN